MTNFIEKNDKKDTDKKTVTKGKVKRKKGDVIGILRINVDIN
jgi:hypothetical protein